MPRNKFCRLEIDMLNATRKFADMLNKQNHKKIYSLKMEDYIGNGKDYSIIEVNSIGSLRENGFARLTYINNSDNCEDYKIKISGSYIKDKNTGKSVPHNIVGRYKEFLVEEIPGIGRKIE